MIKRLIPQPARNASGYSTAGQLETLARINAFKPLSGCSHSGGRWPQGLEKLGLITLGCEFTFH